MTPKADTAEAAENEFTTTHHVYEAHRAGLPPLGTYLRELWRRRHFASESSRADLRTANTMTTFGQLWMVLNPLLLAAVYMFLIRIVSGKPLHPSQLANLTSGLFAYYFVTGVMSAGAASVVGGGRLLLNTAFPRLLLPLAAVRTAFFRFLPTIPVYFVFHFFAHAPIRWQTLLAIPFLALTACFAAGLAALFATLQVYFRDTSSFLPYITRIWLYVSPVLWELDAVPDKLRRFANLNPLFSLLGGYREALVQGHVPGLHTWLYAIAWSLGTLAVGCAYFVSREREFAVRI